MIKRRVFAAVVLYGFALGSALFWKDGEWDWTTIGINIVAATVGLAFLHSRWRDKEARAMTPQQVKDTFS